MERGRRRKGQRLVRLQPQKVKPPMAQLGPTAPPSPQTNSLNSDNNYVYKFVTLYVSNFPVFTCLFTKVHGLSQCHKYPSLYSNIIFCCDSTLIHKGVCGRWCNQMYNIPVSLMFVHV